MRGQSRGAPRLGSARVASMQARPAACQACSQSHRCASPILRGSHVTSSLTGYCSGAQILNRNSGSRRRDGRHIGMCLSSADMRSALRDREAADYFFRGADSHDRVWCRFYLFPSLLLGVSKRDVSGAGLQHSSARCQDECDGRSHPSHRCC